MVEKKVEIDVDSIFSEIGHIGWFQILNITLLMLPIFTGGWGGTDFIFTAGDVNYRCHIPECEGDYSAVGEVYPEWINNAVPNGARCKRYAPIENPPNTGGNCPAALFNTGHTIPCEQYVHDRTNTILYDFNLHCEDWKRTLVGTLRSVGALIFLSISGMISDRYGRKAVVVISYFNTAICGLIRSFSMSYEMFIAMSFLETALGSGAATTGFIIDLHWLHLTIYIVGKYFISLTFCSTYIFTAELFPTQLRHSLLAFSSMIGRIGSMAAPQMPLLIPIWAPLPNTIFGIFSVVSGLLILTMPEMKGIILHDTIEEIEYIEHQKSLSSRRTLEF